LENLQKQRQRYDRSHRFSIGSHSHRESASKDAITRVY
jgi:hypothetical protein